MNAEPPIARFQMEHQPRRPGYARRYPANSSMHKALTVAVTCVILIGCRDAMEHPDTNLAPDLPVTGKFLVPQVELPPQILKLAEKLEKLPTVSSNREFRVTLTSSGLNKEPDHYKDNGHFWFLDRDFNSETDPKKRFYRVAIGYWPDPNDGISFHWAVISREYPTEPWRESLWEIDWFDSSVRIAG